MCLVDRGSEYLARLVALLCYYEFVPVNLNGVHQLDWSIHESGIAGFCFLKMFSKSLNCPRLLRQLWRPPSLPLHHQPDAR